MGLFPYSVTACVDSLIDLNIIAIGTYCVPGTVQDVGNFAEARPTQPDDLEELGYDFWIRDVNGFVIRNKRSKGVNRTKEKMGGGGPGNKNVEKWVERDSRFFPRQLSCKALRQ